MKRTAPKKEYWENPYYGWDAFSHDGRYYNRDFEQQYKRKEKGSE